MIRIDRNSTLFAYYVFIRRMWGFKPGNEKATSLCPFFHTILWLTVAGLCMLPLCIAGYAAVKLLRSVYKYLPFTRGFMDRMDWTARLDNVSSTMRDVPIPTSAFAVQ